MKQGVVFMVTVVMVMVLAYPVFAGDWIKCADEKQYCKTSGTPFVRYGTGDKWTWKKVPNGIYCGNEEFGDPKSNVVKACYVFSPWVKCANEGQYCQFTGTRDVQYGTGNKWTSKKATAKIFCGNQEFGEPAPNTAKACYYYDPWSKCANEGQYCQVSGTREVQYGAGDKWVSKTVTNGIACSNQGFSDPAPNAVKACYAKVE